ncbi:sensor histidine kinase [Lacinutrix iliipiscaria]|uniref:histidine kinase n=1 Tax=Lacinutrix iliipiscaria TaxID=1230532 RepID=A0ABW5WKU3_9FLAO
MKPYLTFLLLLFFFNVGYAQKNKAFQDQLNRIQNYRSLSSDGALTMEERLDYAEKAVELSLQTKEDTIILKSKRNLSLLYMQKGDLEIFKTMSLESLDNAIKIKDTFSIAIANYYLGSYYHINEKHDSAYYHYFNSAKLYKILNDIQSEGEVLSNMADIQETERDYVGCENNAIKAIALIEQLPETERNLLYLWSTHNLIALVSAELEQYQKGLEYHNKALAICERMEDPYESQLFSNINIAALYRRKGDYETAQKLYEKLKEDELVYEFDPTSYSIILSGLAHAKFKNGNKNYDEITTLFHKAYSISKKEDDQFGLLSISMDMSEFYFNTKNMDSARYYVDNAYVIGKDLKANETILEALLLKSEIETGAEAKASLNRYISLSDSLQKAERSIRNKFARIDYETDQIKAEKEQVTKERLLFLILSIGLFITLALLYIVITQRSKNKELKFIQQQQETNEEIYNLMLSQQDNIEEARTIEKRRISEELHDGILGRLFGTRLSLDSLNMSNTEEAMKSREGYIDELQSIEQEIRKVSHDLNSDFVSGSGFTDIIKTLLETQTEAYKLKYEFTKDDAIQWDSISNKTKIHIYRILQESLQNIYKHANATLVEISFSLKNNVICITIKDDGTGFDVNKSRKGIGIKNITSRVKEIDGELTIESQKDIGTSIMITVPTK